MGIVTYSVPVLDYRLGAWCTRYEPEFARATLLSNNSAMPNWNQNSVEIHAPQDAVKAYLVPVEDNTFKFNMHLLYPEVVPSTDPTGDATWDYDWAVINTGSKRYPEIEISSREGAVPTCLDYDTARSPND